MNMKEKLINNFKSLFKSAIDTKALFERRKNNFIFPLIILILSLLMMYVPQYNFIMNVSKAELLKNFPEIKQPLTELFTRSLNCSVKEAKLVCSEETEEVNFISGDNERNIKYNVIVNSTVNEMSDNTIILTSTLIKIRYTQKDYINNNDSIYEIVGDYSKLEGYNFKDVSEKLTNDPSLIDKEVEDFIFNTYNSSASTRFLVSFTTSIIPFMIFILVTIIIIKWPTLLKRKKGFSFIECIKISLTSALPALLISSLAFFLFGMNFSFLFAAIYVFRILFIYFKYISSKNNIFKNLYEETKEERFNF